MPRTADPTDIPERLLSAGLALFLQQGYNATGIQQLSQHLGREVSDDVIAWTEQAAEEFRPELKSIPVPSTK